MLIVKKLRIFRVSINDLIKSCERPQLPCSCISKEDIRTEPSNFCSSLCTDRNPDISFGHRHLYNCISSARTSEEKIFMPKNYREEFSTIWINIKWLHRSTSSAIFRNLLFFVALRIDCWPISVESHMQISNFNRFVCFHNETVFIERNKSVLAHDEFPRTSCCCIVFGKERATGLQ